MGELSPKVLQELPAWAQLAANLGMFAVVFILSAASFIKKLRDTNNPLLTDLHFEDGGALHRVGEKLTEYVDNTARSAKALERIASVMEEEAEEKRVEREVQRRLREREGGHA